MNIWIVYEAVVTLACMQSKIQMLQAVRTEVRPLETLQLTWLTLTVSDREENFVGCSDYLTFWPSLIPAKFDSTGTTNMRWTSDGKINKIEQWVDEGCCLTFAGCSGGFQLLLNTKTDLHRMLIFLRVHTTSHYKINLIEEFHLTNTKLKS